MRFWLVNVSVWLSVACWFAGATIYLIVRKRASIASITWAVGVLLMVMHTAASYGYEHDWSHQAALRFTGDESESVTGVRAEWGLYANFLFIFVWFCLAYVWRKSPLHVTSMRLMMCVYLGLIVFFATIVFENGWIRFASIAGFLTLVCAGVWRMKRLNDSGSWNQWGNY